VFKSTQIFQANRVELAVAVAELLVRRGPADKIEIARELARVGRSEYDHRQGLYYGDLAVALGLAERWRASSVTFSATIRGEELVRLPSQVERSAHLRASALANPVIHALVAYLERQPRPRTQDMVAIFLATHSSLSRPTVERRASSYFRVLRDLHII
jgi:hypothetical protein